MWYEIIPSAAIVWVLLAVPGFAAPGINYLFNNRHVYSRRWHTHHQDYHLYLRDQRITGSEYRPQGLEGVPED